MVIVHRTHSELTILFKNSAISLSINKIHNILIYESANWICPLNRNSFGFTKHGIKSHICTRIFDKKQGFYSPKGPKLFRSSYKKAAVLADFRSKPLYDNKNFFNQMFLGFCAKFIPINSLISQLFLMPINATQGKSPKWHHVRSFPYHLFHCFIKLWHMLLKNYSGVVATFIGYTVKESGYTYI